MFCYVEPVIRPPSEADSLILQATLGCSHNRCAFCVTYQGKPYRARPLPELFAEIDTAAEELTGLRRVFLADGDALALPTDHLLSLLDRLYSCLPDLRRVTSYASPGNFRRKSTEQLRALREAGLTMVYVGLESGDDEVLQRVRKGATHQEMVQLCQKATEAGLKLFVTVILGLGGPRLSQQHAEHTAELIDRIRPRFASALTLMIAPRRPSFEEVFADPSWRELTTSEILTELRTLVTHIHAKGIVFHANHASNYLPLKGVLQKDKARLLNEIEAALADPNHLRPAFLRSF